MATTNVSCEGDRQYVETLGMLAKKRRVSIGRLVRAAIDKEYGAELIRVEKLSSLFFADDGASEFKDELERTGTEHA